MAYKMKGFSGFKGSPAKQTKFPENDITNDGSKEDNQRIKTAKKLQHEADILRNRKSPGKMYGKKSPAKQTKFPNSLKARKRKVLKEEKNLKPMDPKMMKKLYPLATEMMEKNK